MGGLSVTPARTGGPSRGFTSSADAFRDTAYMQTCKEPVLTDIPALPGMGNNFMVYAAYGSVNSEIINP